MSGQQLTPEVLWAQRSSDSDAERNFVYLTIMASDVSEKDMKLDLQPTSIKFSGYSQSKKVTYAVELDFYAEIDPKESKIHHSDRAVEMVLRKKELKEEFWPRLLKESKRLHFLKTDFDKWVDEDEQDAAGDDEDMMSKMNPMGGAGGDGGFGGIDFSKLGGGAGGMPDMSAMGDMMGGMGGAGGEDEDDDEDDEDMPALEDEEGVEKAETGKGKGKESAIPEATGETGASATKTSKIEEVE